MQQARSIGLKLMKSTFQKNTGKAPFKFYSRYTKKYITMADFDFQEEKDKFLNMELEEKRKLYRCEDDFVPISKLEPWPAYFAKKKKEIKLEIEEKHKRPVDPEANEKIVLWQGDITTLEVDSIVNAANNSLLGGGGVDGAIHRAAGGILVKECATLNGCPDGQAKITGGYKLPAKFVVHTVGPRGEKPEILRSCYENCLNVMLENNLKSIAIPCISTGIYGYPNDKAANVALHTVRKFLDEHKSKVDKIIFTTFLPEDVEIYENFLQKYFPVE